MSSYGKDPSGPCTCPSPDCTLHTTTGTPLRSRRLWRNKHKHDLSRPDRGTTPFPLSTRETNSGDVSVGCRPPHYSAS